MSLYRDNLPQLSGTLMLTDGGLETTLIFHNGLELPHFAAFDLLREIEGRQTLKDYFRRYAAIATDAAAGFILESPTYKANADYGDKLGYSAEALRAANVEAIELLDEIRRELATEASPFVIAGCVGPRGDGYNPADRMTADEAQDYHSTQIETFADAGADFISAMTLNDPDEAIGIVRASKAAGMPVSISFTVETDGRLPCGLTIREAIETVDAATDGYAAYFMINCAHPSHFEGELEGDSAWAKRILGIRANASRKSHAELDESEELDDGNPEEFGANYRDLKALLPHLTVFGGCCGTDHRHVTAVCHSCIAA